MRFGNKIYFLSFLYVSAYDLLYVRSCFYIFQSFTGRFAISFNFTSFDFSFEVVLAAESANFDVLLVVELLGYNCRLFLVQDKCGEAMKLWGYKMVESESELQTFRSVWILFYFSFPVKASYNVP